MPSTDIRKTLARARHVVVKMGTALLTGADGRLDLPYIRAMAGQVARLRAEGRRVTLVSSGAIGAGMAHLGLSERPGDVAELQAVAAVGQPQLMRNFREAFERFDLKVAQLLLTRQDFDDRARFLNIRNCVQVLQRMGCVPVINENDTVAVDEIRFGDNDTLAALICNALPAEALVILTVVDGLLDAAGARIDLVRDAAESTGVIRAEKSRLGTGGMATKNAAAWLVANAGEIAVIAGGRTPDVLPRLFAGESIGTVFAPAGRKLDSRRRWIGLTRRAAGRLTIDDGAAAALLERHKSLLASGIRAVQGDFEAGDVVAVCDARGRELARGMCNYNAAELRLIAGKKSSQFEAILGRPAFAEVVHRDNLLVL